MDPFTSLSLATAIIQITDFSCKLVKNGHEVYKNGSTEENSDIERATDGLKRLTLTLSDSLASAPSAPKTSLQDEELMLQQLASSTANVAAELLDLLNSTSQQVEGDKKRKRAAQVLKSLANQPKVADMVKKLETYRNDLVLRVVVSLKLNADLHLAQRDERFAALEQESKQIAAALLDNKSYFTSGFGKLQQGQETEAELARIRHEETIAAIETLRGNHATSVSMELTENSLQDLGKIQQEILDFLWFRFMTDRGAEISAAYGSTFEWSHSDTPGSTEAGGSFAAWLREGDGIYWINGKAGSGKSTFMKHVAAQPSTTDLLQTWAEDTPLLCAPIFFWASGTTLQKTQEGLLRSILHESLSRHPELVPVVFPTLSRLLARGRLIGGEPSLTELKEAFLALMKQTVSPLKICLFIDGVDEYSGDHVELVEFLRRALSPEVKFVLSSRPTPSCLEAFSGFPSFRLQDHTRPDIQHYVVGNLLARPVIADMARSHESELWKLFEDIVDRSSGVFLWVILTVKALGSAAANFDSIADLRKRVDELPADIDGLYWSMLARMDPVYRSQAAMLLQIMHQSTLVPQKVPMSSLRLSFAMDGIDAAIDAEAAPLSAKEISRRRQAMEGMIRSRCCGLLETHMVARTKSRARAKTQPRPLSDPILLPSELAQYLDHLKIDVPAEGIGILRAWMILMDSGFNLSRTYDDDFWTYDDYPLTYPGDDFQKEPTELHEEVHFIHKSVVDFLEQPQVRQDLQKSLGGASEFDASVSLIAASLRELKAAEPEHEQCVGESNNPSLVWDTMVRALHECALAERSTGQPQDLLLEELDAVMDHHWRLVGGWLPRFGKSLEVMKHWSYHFNCGQMHCDSMFSVACLFGLERYATQVLESALGNATAQSALELMVTDTSKDEISFYWGILDACFKHGADVNRPFHRGMSPWQVVLTRCNPTNVTTCETWAGLIYRMIDAGSDVNKGTEDVECVSNKDYRISRRPLDVLRERFAHATWQQTRASGRKIRLMFEKLQRHIVGKGGSYGHVVEEEAHEMVDGKYIRCWRPVLDPEVARRVWESSCLGRYTWH